jgi:hypothetical protein
LLVKPLPEKGSELALLVLLKAAKYVAVSRSKCSLPTEGVAVFAAGKQA